MDVLVINCGSSSLKYQLINSETENVLAKGICERIGTDKSCITHQTTGKEKISLETPMPTHMRAVQLVIDNLTDPKTGAIESVDEIAAVGHRIVHGGEHFTKACIVDQHVIEELERIQDLAPLHNPAHLIGINACRELMPHTPMVTVFDTAFHQTMPRKAFLYGLPYEYYEKYAVRRYGFHGTSHEYVSHRAIEMLKLDKENSKVVVCHLGNGASLSAVKGGKCIDTSMGLTPLAGLIMGTRSGDIDPAIMNYVAEKENLTLKEMTDVLNKKSGVYGMSGVSSDFRDLENAMNDGNEKAKDAMDAFAYRVAKYIGEYMMAMGGLDAVIFTAGIGENSGTTRAMIMKYLEFLETKVDEENNKVRGEEAIISTPDSKVICMVVPTNEELAIARQTVALVE